MSRWAWPVCLVAGWLVTMAISSPAPYLLLFLFGGAPTRSAGPELIPARHGNSEVALTRNFAETDGIIVHTLLLRRQGTAERPLARYTIPFDLTRGAEGLGCNDLPLEIAPRGGTIAIEELARKQSVMLAHADWPSPVSITIHIPIIDGAFRQRVDNVGGIGITYDVGCTANPFAR